MAPSETKSSDNPLSETNGDKKPELKSENAANNEPGRPLAPPPKPGEDYFSSNLSLEPNPFEQSFGTGGTVETPGGTKLPSVAALTSPSSLLPGNGNTPFNWGGGSLRTGPLSPAMLSGPANDYFGDTSHTLRGGFTPNESSLRTGLTPGGSGSMFPAPSPNSQALFAQLASGTATPSTLDFHRTAMSAAAAKANRDKQQPQPVTSQPETNGTQIKTEAKQSSGAFDPHDNDAANGLFMLAQGAQGRNGTQTQYPVGGNQPVHAHPAPPPPNQANSTSPQMNGNGAATTSPTRGVSEAASGASDDSEPAKPSARGKGKRGSTAATNGRRKAEEAPAKQPANKKPKTAPSLNGNDMSSDEEDDEKGDSHPKSKMTDEEKRKNFLERNRVAALKCRQRKKQWLANLQSKVEMFSSENDALTAQISQLREEVVNLKTLLLAHKDCPVTQQQGLHGAFMQQAMETYNPQINPYGMAAPIPNQPVMAGQGVQRRFS
ncbi:Aft1 HRA domain-containing protein [Annulohypoxylon nitens]|nr:Aft1 HRA domain-containing protein [Annulohypoxylon nitens]KAI1441531.1 Aft1 HRA domain-containing protein [Annulohypoxylon stygium]